MTTQGVSALAQPIQIGTKTAVNRIVYQPMEANDADDRGRPSARTVERYRRFAAGGPGIIFVEATNVWPESRGRVNQLRIQAETARSLEELVDAMKKENPEPLVLFQLTHDGRQAGSFSRRVSVYPTGEPDVEVLTTEEIEAISGAFARAAAVAYSVGADGIDFKHCHGYLCCEMLRPANQREDRYGGSFENRSRFFRETTERIQQAVSDPGFVLGCRVSVYEPQRGGIGTAGQHSEQENLTEPLALVRLMEEAGLHYVDVTAGNPLTVPGRTEFAAVSQHFRLTEAVKQATHLAVIGSAYSFLRDGKNGLPGSDAKGKSFAGLGGKNVAEGKVDLVGVGRQSFADPLFARKILNSAEDIRFCTLCNGCRRLLHDQRQSGCTAYDPFYRALLKETGEE